MLIAALVTTYSQLMKNRRAWLSRLLVSAEVVADVGVTDLKAGGHALRLAFVNLDPCRHSRIVTLSSVKSASVAGRPRLMPATSGTGAGTSGSISQVNAMCQPSALRLTVTFFGPPRIERASVKLWDPCWRIRSGGGLGVGWPSRPEAVHVAPPAIRAPAGA